VTKGVVPLFENCRLETTQRDGQTGASELALIAVLTGVMQVSAVS
jgi:hypothetical protein